MEATKTAKSGKSTSTKSSSSTTRKSGSGKGKSSSQCWTGYERVPGKTPGSKGSCKPKSSAKKTTKSKK